jgi:hypothetical protein
MSRKQRKRGHIDRNALDAGLSEWSPAILGNRATVVRVLINADSPLSEIRDCSFRKV